MFISVETCLRRQNGLEVDSDFVVFSDFSIIKSKLHFASLSCHPILKLTYKLQHTTIRTYKLLRFFGFPRVQITSLEWKILAHALYVHLSYQIALKNVTRILLKGGSHPSHNIGVGCTTSLLSVCVASYLNK